MDRRMLGRAMVLGALGTIPFLVGALLWRPGPQTWDMASTIQYAGTIVALSLASWFGIRWGQLTRRPDAYRQATAIVLVSVVLQFVVGFVLSIVDDWPLSELVSRRAILIAVGLNGLAWLVALVGTYWTMAQPLPSARRNPPRPQP